MDRVNISCVFSACPSVYLGCRAINRRDVKTANARIIGIESGVDSMERDLQLGPAGVRCICLLVCESVCSLKIRVRGFFRCLSP